MNPLPQQPSNEANNYEVSESNILYYCAIIKPPVYKIRGRVRTVSFKEAFDRCYGLTGIQPVHKKINNQQQWTFIKGKCYITGVRDRIELTRQFGPGKLRVLRQAFNLTNCPASLIINVLKERDSFKRHCLILDYQLSNPVLFPELAATLQPTQEHASTRAQ